MTIQELKTLAYDHLRQINTLQQQLIQIEQEIVKKEKEEQELKKEES